MAEVIYICTTDDVCSKHGRFIYYCNTCHEDYFARHPRTRDAIANGGGPREIDTAREADLAARIKP